MIEKINFRDQVREYLLEKMRTSELKAGESLSLAKLARELDVSVTPIREALTQLQNAQIISSIPNRGFVIPELNKVEAKELYELVATLESFIVKSSNYSTRDLSQLKKLHVSFKNSTDGIERINADFEFHEFIISKYENSFMKKILMDTKTRIFFYELEFMNDESYYDNSDDQHQLIIEYLEKNNSDKAAKLIVENWMSILNHINKL